MTRRRAEEPALALADASVCLHFVEIPAERDCRLDYPDCPFFRSMELDLLAHQFQLDRWFGSECVVKQPVAAEIVFPETIVYRSEGREVELVCPEPIRPVRLLVSKTTFFRSKVVVWHVAIEPRAGGRFNEFDVIKLIHLYGGVTEATNVAKRVRFRLPDRREVGVDELVDALTPGGRREVNPVAGTVELLVRGEGLVFDAEQVLEVLHGLHSDEDGRLTAKVERWFAEKNPESAALIALNGIVTGIFDFDEIDASEIADTLIPTVPSAPGLLKISRATLVQIADEDRAFEQCSVPIGASPYLLIPHAVLLHNEALVTAAAQAADEVLGGPKRTLGNLSAARAIADRNLNRLIVPNVFNYPTERALREAGAVARGDEDRRASTAGMLRELTSLVDDRWERRRETGGLVLSALLLVLTMLQVREPIQEYLSMFVPGGLVNAGFLVATVLSVGLLVGVTYGSRRK